MIEAAGSAPASERLARGALRALWNVAIPALLAATVLRYLVPGSGPGIPGAVADLGRRYAVISGACLFLAFSGLLRYWGSRVLPEQPARRASPRRDALVTVLAVGAACAAALAFRTFVMQPYHVLSGSMLPTFEPDDVIAGNKLGRAGGEAGAGALPRRGDVVVFESSAVALGRGDWPGQLVKRVIGLPGDRVTMEGGLPRINDWQVPSCAAGRYVYILPDATGGALFGHIRVEFLDDRAYLTLNAVPVAPFEATYVVQPGEVFVLGDNRNNSLDSRAWNQGRGGGVPLGAIDARARWFLVGRHRSGDVDLGRLFRNIDSLQAQVRVEGVDGSEVEAGIARCLANRPAATRPPEPGQPSASSASPASGT